MGPDTRLSSRDLGIYCALVSAYRPDSITAMKLDLDLQISSVVPHLKRWPGKGERPYQMADLIVKTKPNIVVELGVFVGGTLIPQALALKHNQKGTIIGIDPYDMTVIMEGLSDEERADLWETQDLTEAYQIVIYWIIKLELKEHVRMFRRKSEDCADRFKTSEIDILHIDASHSEKSSCADVELYRPKMKKGGYIWFDDTHFKSVQKALRELETFCTLKHDYETHRLYQVG